MLINETVIKMIAIVAAAIASFFVSFANSFTLCSYYY